MEDEIDIKTKFQEVLQEVDESFKELNDSSFNPYYDRKGNKITLMQWGELYQDFAKNRLVKQQYLSNGDWISTVFLGMDHSFVYNDDPHVPIIFETMIFAENASYDNYCERFATEEEARARHKEIVQAFKKNRFRRYLQAVPYTRIP